MRTRWEVGPVGEIPLQLSKRWGESGKEGMCADIIIFSFWYH